MDMIADTPTAPSVQRTDTSRPGSPAPGRELGNPGGTSGGTSAAGEFLTFRLGDEEYGIDILRVQEIRSYEPPTRIANAPACIKGVVNLRGVIVPIVDLRLKLGCDKVEYNGSTVVVVLNVRGRVVGAVVDSVSDVLELGRDHIKPAPQMHSSIDASCITGIGTIQHTQATDTHTPGTERMLILLDIEALMSSVDDAP